MEHFSTKALSTKECQTKLSNFYNARSRILAAAPAVTCLASKYPDKLKQWSKNDASNQEQTDFSNDDFGIHLYHDKFGASVAVVIVVRLAGEDYGDRFVWKATMIDSNAPNSPGRPISAGYDGNHLESAGYLLDDRYLFPSGGVDTCYFFDSQSCFDTSDSKVTTLDLGRDIILNRMQISMGAVNRLASHPYLFLVSGKRNLLSVYDVASKRFLVKFVEISPPLQDHGYFFFGRFVLFETIRGKTAVYQLVDEGQKLSLKHISNIDFKGTVLDVNQNFVVIASGTQNTAVQEQVAIFSLRTGERIRAIPKTVLEHAPSAVFGRLGWGTTSNNTTVVYDLLDPAGLKPLFVIPQLCNIVFLDFGRWLVSCDGSLWYLDFTSDSAKLPSTSKPFNFAAASVATRV